MACTGYVGKACSTFRLGRDTWREPASCTGGQCDQTVPVGEEKVLLDSAVKDCGDAPCGVRPAVTGLSRSS